MLVSSAVVPDKNEKMSRGIFLRAVADCIRVFLFRVVDVSAS